MFFVVFVLNLWMFGRFLGLFFVLEMLWCIETYYLALPHASSLALASLISQELA